MKNFDFTRVSSHLSLVLLLLCCLSVPARADEVPEDPSPAAAGQAAERTVTGTVTDAEGHPLIGATIVVKDAPTVSGTITGPDGTFSLTVPARSTLLITYVGYKSLRLPVLNRTHLEITLEEDAERLDNVVVVGYGTQEKSDLTGSIASIKASDIKNLPVRSVAEALQGKVAGVMVTKTSGKPGASSDIVIRGVGSINGLNPLFVIDGVASENSTSYNLNDIASIEVIKDASAAAIYGSRAAGGVVLITTRKGSYNARPQLSFTSHVGVRQYTDMYRMLGTEDYIRVMQELGVNYPIWSDPSSLPDTDWVGEIYQPGLEQSYNLSLTGGSDRFRYYLSGGYERENGIQMNNYWERISARLNVDYRVAPSLTVGTRIYLARLRGNPYTESFPWVSIPYMSIYDEDGGYASIPSGIDFSGANPVADIAYHHQKQSDLVANGDLFVDWEIVKGLKLNVTGSAQLGGGLVDNFSEANTLGRSPSKDSYTKTLDYAEQYTFTATLTYEKLFAGKHDLRVMVGYEARSAQLADLSATASDFPINNPESFALSTNPTKKASGALTEDRFLSQFARLNYTYDNRYLLTMNVRRDGSPKFGPKNRWGIFPSVSVGWKISEEPFFKAWNPAWVSMIKPRFSWGILGNDQALNQFAYMAAYQNVTSHSFDGSSAVGGYSNIKVVNEDIKWESIYTTDVGLDVDLFRNRLSIAHLGRQPFALAVGVVRRGNVAHGGHTPLQQPLDGRFAGIRSVEPRRKAVVRFAVGVHEGQRLAELFVATAQLAAVSHDGNSGRRGDQRCRQYRNPHPVAQRRLAQRHLVGRAETSFEFGHLCPALHLEERILHRDIPPHVGVGLRVVAAVVVDFGRQVEQPDISLMERIPAGQRLFDIAAGRVELAVALEDDGRGHVVERPSGILRRGRAVRKRSSADHFEVDPFAGLQQLPGGPVAEIGVEDEVLQADLLGEVAELNGIGRLDQRLQRLDGPPVIPVGAIG